MKHSENPFNPKMELYVNLNSVIYQIVYGRGANLLADLVKAKDIIDFVTSGNPAEVMSWLERSLHWAYRLGIVFIFVC